MTATFKITDGTTEISLLNGEDGFYINFWRPVIPQYKGGGIFRDSPLADGRRLVARQFQNAIEPLNMKLGLATDQDDLIRATQELRRLLEKAVDYWATDWQNEPVWIEAQATCETNLRYALVHSYSTPDDDNPFAQPFLQRTGAAMDNWMLFLERGHWLANQPGTGTCVEVSGTGLGYTPSEIYYPLIGADDGYAANGTASLDITGTNVIFGNFGAGGAIDAFIRFRNVAVPQGATIHAAFVRFTSTQTNSSTTVNTTIYAQDSGAPGPLSTYADYIARERTTANVAWNGVPGWVIGNTYDTPSIVTIVQEVVNRDDWVSGSDIVIFVEDNASSVNANRKSASLENVTYDEIELHLAHSGRIAGRAATCDDEVYIANKQNTAQLTHVLVDDGGVWGGNLIGAALPFDLYPAVPAVGDAIYFGIDTSIADSGPFSSLVFDLSVAQTGITDIVWEFWNGAAWGAIANIQDNTDADGAMTGEPFDTIGVKSVHWRQVAGWVTRDISLDGGPAVTGYWVRARVNTIGVPTPPTQQNRDIYTITWPYFEVDSTQVEGDIPATVRVRLRNQADNGAGGAEAFASSVVAGLRSNSRGTNFASFINLANEQNPSGVTVTQFGTGVLTVDASAPTGVLLRVTNPGAAWATVGTIAFDETIAPEYLGEYHGYLRVDQTSGSVGDLRFRVLIQYAIGGVATDSAVTLGPWYLNNTGVAALLDMGKIKLPPSQTILPANTFELLLTIQIFGNGTTDVDIFDLILMPTDECAVQMLVDGGVLFLGNRNAPATTSAYLDMDNLTLPKLGLQGILRNHAADLILRPWATRANTDFILQANVDQRIHFLNLDTRTGFGPLAYLNNANSLYVTDNERYLSMRGAR